MSRYLSLARKAYSEGNPFEVLIQLRAMFRALQKTGPLPYFPAGVRAADALLDSLGTALWEAVPATPGPPRQDIGLVLATFVYPTGGHTPVINDVRKAFPQATLELWLTLASSHGRAALKEAALVRTGFGDNLRVFDNDNPFELARAMVTALARLRPATVFLLHHPEDCVAAVVAAAARASGARILLLHHSDARPAAGLYLKDTTIIDFTPRACSFTRHMLGLPSAWIPLTCRDFGTVAHPFFSHGRLCTALSCSGPEKIARLADPDYPELVTAVLAATGGTHVHVGGMKGGMLRRIHTLMRRRGIAKERFLWIPHAPSLAEVLHAQQVDLVINTYPAGGARTAVEVMSTGVPMLWRSPTEELDGVLCQSRYPEAFIWRRLDELLDCLRAIDCAWLKDQGEAARRHFDARHHPSRWAEAMHDLEGALGRELPGGFDGTEFTRALVERLLDGSTPPRSALQRIRNVLSSCRGKPADEDKP